MKLRLLSILHSLASRAAARANAWEAKARKGLNRELLKDLIPARR